MATYKVIQDIEAEDKLVGPLSLRQFIYAGIAALLLYLSFICLSKGASLFLIVLLPPALFCAFFAFPWSREQPTEVWALAKIRFFLKPRKRIWNQSGVKELVTITVPKKIERVITNGLTQNEVRSRLNALASTIDSRGWAIKNVDASLYAQPLMGQATDSDRLLGISNMPQQVATTDITASDDILDEQNNPLAQQFNQMMNASAQSHRQAIEQRLQQSAPVAAPATAGQATQPADYWFLNQPAQAPAVPRGTTTFAAPRVVLPGGDDSQPANVQPAEPTASEEAFAEQLKTQNNYAKPNYGHMRNISPLGEGEAAAPASAVADSTMAPAAAAEPVAPPDPTADASAMTPPSDPAKIDLARNNDLSVATIARLANHKDKPDEPNEVVISLR